MLFVFVSGGAGPAMLPTIGDAAPKMLGVLLVLGGLLDLVLAAGIPVTTPAVLSTSNHSENRYSPNLVKKKKMVKVAIFALFSLCRLVM